MGIIGGKFMFVVIALVGLLGAGLVFGIYTNLLRWEHDAYQCYPGTKGFYKAVPPQRIGSFFSVKFYYQPYTWGCTEDARYSPDVYRVENGTLVPKADSASGAVLPNRQ